MAWSLFQLAVERGPARIRLASLGFVGLFAAIAVRLVAFGHGIAVTPLQGAMTVAALVNGGDLITPTFLAGRGPGHRLRARAVIKPETAASARRAALDPDRRQDGNLREGRWRCLLQGEGDNLLRRHRTHRRAALPVPDDP